MPKYLAFWRQHFSSIINPKQAKSPDIQGFFGGGAEESRTPCTAAGYLRFLT
jgi:hypothetical protein|nr:MAG TPA: hypothetical protein [Caudoviricetes sp.]